MAKPRVFVSHSHKDDAFTGRLVDDLRAAGADVWVDVANMGAGDFMERINEALSDCEWAVLVLTEDALSSPWVRMEVNAAIRLKHQGHIHNVLPVKAGPVDLGKLPPLWGVFNVFDATRDFAAACEQVRSALGLPAIPNTPKRPVKSASKGSVPTPAAQPAESASDVLARGKALNAQDKFAEALPLLQRATELDPSSVEAWANLSRALSLLNRPEDGLAASERALSLNSAFAYSWYAKGAALHNLKRYDEALGAHDRALALDPNDAYAWNGRGAALTNLKRHNEALAAYDKALAIDPKFAQALSNKAISLRALGRHAEATVAERRAKALRG